MSDDVHDAERPLVWHALAPDALRETRPTLVAIGSTLLVLASSEGRWFAFDRHCPHVGGPMLKCELTGAVVTCPLHGWSFDLDAEGREIHGYRPLRRFPVRVEDGELLVGMPGWAESPNALPSRSG